MQTAKNLIRLGLGRLVISSPAPQAHKVSFKCYLSVSQSVCVSTLSNMNIFETSGLIATKFYLKHHRDGGKATLVLGQIGLELWYPWHWIVPIGL